MRTFSTGFFDRITGRPEREARHPWPEDCHIQAGGNGIVLTSGSIADVIEDPAKGLKVLGAALGEKTYLDHYRTAFFEAFPRDPNTFIRGEGKTIEKAEDSDGSSSAHAPFTNSSGANTAPLLASASVVACWRSGLRKTLDPCFLCGRDDNKASHGPDRFDRWHCETCFQKIPEDEKSEIHKSCDRMRAGDT